MSRYTISQVSPLLGDEEIAEVRAVIERGWLTEGPCTARFVEALKSETGSAHAVMAPNGTLGLFLALLALDLPRGSEILIPSFTFSASASAAVYAGLTPVFVDSDPRTFNLDIDRLDDHVTGRTRAIMPVHIYGHCAAMDGVLDVAARHGLAVIEDAAQACGVRYQGRHAGTWGDVGVISFFADKTITTGEGAVVLTQRDDLYQRLRLIRNQGRLHSGTFVHPHLGMNFRVTDLQSAVGLVQLRRLRQLTGAKLANYQAYRERLENLPGARFLTVQAGSSFVPFRFVMTTARRAAVVTALEESGVQTRSFFCPLHQQPYLRDYVRRPLPVAEALYEQGICLPIHVDMTPASIAAITDTIWAAST